MQVSSETPLQKFESFIKNQETKTTYQLALNLFMKDCKIADPSELIIGKKEDIQALIVQWLKHQTFSKANRTMAALKTFYKANEQEDSLKWGYLRGRMPAQPAKVNTYRGYYREEIIQVLEAAKAQKREELAIFTMASAGLRIGALTELQVKHLVPIQKYQLLALRVYADTKFQYWTFLTPEGSLKMLQYVKGLKANDYIFANLNVPELRVSRKVLSMAIWRLLVKSGLRTPGDRLQRQEVQTDHGFRKFFRTQIESAGLRLDHCLILMGQGGRLRDIYSTPRPEEWLETCQYFKAIDRLTFYPKKPATAA
jgi:integrase